MYVLHTPLAFPTPALVRSLAHSPFPYTDCYLFWLCNILFRLHVIKMLDNLREMNAFGCFGGCFVRFTQPGSPGLDGIFIGSLSLQCRVFFSLLSFFALFLSLRVSMFCKFDFMQTGHGLNPFCSRLDQWIWYSEQLAHVEMNVKIISSKTNCYIYPFFPVKKQSSADIRWMNDFLWKYKIKIPIKFSEFSCIHKLNTLPYLLFRPSEFIYLFDVLSYLQCFFAFFFVERTYSAELFLLIRFASLHFRLFNCFLHINIGYQK